MTYRELQALLLPVLLACTLSAGAADMPPIRVEARAAIADAAIPSGTVLTHTLALTVANIAAWPEAEITAAVHETARILAQCGIRIARADLVTVAAPDAHRYFETPRSRELARALALPKPTLYFTAGTRQTPAFDAEAIGRGNSRTRPELADTVWIARGARDLGIVVAHELAHVLMDSGAHENSPGNLMAESTTPKNTQLSGAQCTRIRATGARNGLLHSGVN